MATVHRRIIDEQISDVLMKRNGALSGKAPIKYRQLLNSRYADGVKMVSVGGLFSEQTDFELLPDDSFTGLDFVRNE